MTNGPAETGEGGALGVTPGVPGPRPLASSGVMCTSFSVEVWRCGTANAMDTLIV